jgi:SPP1 family predicted phage head-tail adaptor
MIYQGKVINPGRLNRPIKLKARTETSNAGGFQQTGTSLIGSTWGECRPAYGNESWVAGILLAEKPTTVLTRYNAQLDDTCLIEIDGRDYEIVGLIDLDLAHEFYEIKVKLVKAG